MVKKEAPIYDYDSYKTDSEKNVSDHFCFVTDWFSEELPLENENGDCLEILMRDMLEYASEPDPYYEQILTEEQKKKKEVPKINDPPKPKKEKVLVFSDHQGFCDNIFKYVPKGRLEGNGKPRMETKQASAYSQEDVTTLLKTKWDMIVFATGLDPPGSNSVADVISQNTAITKLYYFILKAIMAHPANCKRLAVLAHGAVAHEKDLYEKGGLGFVTGATLFGMTNTARMELASATDEEIPIQFIDTEIEPFAPKWVERNYVPVCLPERIASEIFRLVSFGHNTVRLLHTHPRYVLRQLPSKAYEVAEKKFELPAPGSIIGISGGNGSLGLLTSDWLMKEAEEQKVTGFTIQLLSRSMKISDEKLWTALQKKASGLGITIEQAKLDMSTQAAMDSYVSGCNDKLGGFIHSAGVLQDSLISSLTWQQCESVFDAKHRAALYLHESLEKFEQPGLKFLWMFSSIAVYGNMGQTNYSGSNSFLDALAKYRVAMGKPGMAVQWGGWGEVGMAAKLDKNLIKNLSAGALRFHTNKEGFLGLESGLKAGVPNFACFAVNTNNGAVYKQSEDGSTVMQCYSRNFTSEMIPTPLAPDLERKNLMSAFRNAHGFYTWKSNPGGSDNEWMVWNQYVLPVVTSEDYEGDFDFEDDW